MLNIVKAPYKYCNLPYRTLYTTYIIYLVIKFSYKPITSSFI